MFFKWLFRLVALFLGRKAWEAFQRRRQSPTSRASTGATGRV